MCSPRPSAFVAGGLGCLQAIIWGALSLLGILLYTGGIEWIRPEKSDISRHFELALVELYFVPPDTPLDIGVMKPETVVVWTSIYFATSVIWLVISGLLLYDSCKSKFNPKIIIGWVAVSAVIAAIDLAGAIAFGMDYNTIQSDIRTIQTNYPFADGYIIAAIFMMIMCARGFFLWIINVGLVIYLGAVARKKLNEQHFV